MRQRAVVIHVCKHFVHAPLHACMHAHGVYMDGNGYTCTHAPTDCAHTHMFAERNVRHEPLVPPRSTPLQRDFLLQHVVLCYAERVVRNEPLVPPAQVCPRARPHPRLMLQRPTLHVATCCNIAHELATNPACCNRRAHPIPGLPPGPFALNRLLPAATTWPFGRNGLLGH